MVTKEKIAFLSEKLKSFIATTTISKKKTKTNNDKMLTDNEVNEGNDNIDTGKKYKTLEKSLQKNEKKKKINLFEIK